jgi:hypothetical protein
LPTVGGFYYRMPEMRASPPIGISGDEARRGGSSKREKRFSICLDPCAQRSPLMRHTALQRGGMQPISPVADFNAAPLSSSQRCRRPFPLEGFDFCRTSPFAGLRARLFSFWVHTADKAFLARGCAARISAFVWRLTEPNGLVLAYLIGALPHFSKRHLYCVYSPFEPSSEALRPERPRLFWR